MSNLTDKFRLKSFLFLLAILILNHEIAYAQSARPVCGLYRGGVVDGTDLIASPNPADSIADTDAACINYCDLSSPLPGDLCRRGANTIKSYIGNEPNLNIYVSNSGLPTNSGLTSTSAVNTLLRANEIAKAQRLIKDRPITVIIDSGIYFGQQLIWDSFSHYYPTTIRTATGVTGHVIFDGRLDSANIYGSKNYFMNVKITANNAQVAAGGFLRGYNVNFTVKNLHVRYYFEGITFSGLDRNEPLMVNQNYWPSQAMRGVSLMDSKFEKIGNRWAIYFSKGELRTAKAAVRLVNTQKSSFINNEFIDVNNSDYRGTLLPVTEFYGGGLHPFYIAHSSSDNTFEGNKFIRSQSGSSVKVRDQSHNNVIVRNLFDQVTYPIQLWHCEPNEILTVNKVSRIRGLNLSSDDPSTTGLDESKNDVGCTKHPLNPTPEIIDGLKAPVRYECFSTGVKETENLFQRDEFGVNFSSTNVPYSLLSGVSPAYACGEVASSYNFQRDSAIVNSGFIQRTYLSGKYYFGRCAATTECVNSANKCYSSDSGSSHLWCVNNQWKTCAASAEGTTFGSKICTKVIVNSVVDYIWK